MQANLSTDMKHKIEEKIEPEKAMSPMTMYFLCSTLLKLSNNASRTKKTRSPRNARTPTAVP